MENKCKNCKWWEGHGGYNGEDYDDDDTGTCKSEYLHHWDYTGGYPMLGENEFALYSDSEEKTIFITGPDFGCIHFEAKEPEIEEKRFVIENYSQYYKYLKKDQTNICGAGQAYSRLVEELGSPFVIIERYREGKLHGRSFKSKEAKQ